MICETVARECDKLAQACAKRPPVFLTGHSLGGGYAQCTFFHALANHGEPLMRELCQAVSEGGVFTFGAPLVVAPSQESALQSLGKLYHLAVGQPEVG
ncbi:hypothetical protein WJX72_000687 [[Myrmecia] bisecta]|uniref:Fungal lipase-type domain-containing protein n=1 Tax=[Myrmecia] bisecta TaxID=41462 RepID=A0AAW1PN84_9CHLO